MNRFVKFFSMAICAVALAIVIGLLTGCGEASAATYDTADDVNATIKSANKLVEAQPTPKDIEYSLERYNLIRRAYWVNGQREKAASVVCPIEKPLGYIVLFTESGGIVGRFVVDGKVSSLNSYLTPDSEYYEQEYYNSGSSFGNAWLADVDGSYGQNDNGIFFFTPDGKYVEWTGIYLYSDIPFEVSDPVVNIQED